MIPFQKSQQYTDLPAEGEAQGPLDPEEPIIEEVHAIATSPPTESLDTLEERPDIGTPVLSQGLSQSLLETNPTGQSSEGFSIQESDASASSCPDPDPEPEVSLIIILEKMVVELVKFLIAKYKTKEPVTEGEMLQSVIKEQKDYFPAIFKNACECMEVVFGIEVKEVDPISHSYMLIEMLDLSYYRKLSDDQHMAKPGLLILILGIIFMEGNHAPEERVWEMLSMLEMFGKEEFMSGDSKRVLIKELVQEQYLEYQQVPNSPSPSYEFVWGAKSYAETSKIKVFEIFSKVSGSHPTSFSALYTEAFREERERAHSAGDAANVDDENSSAKSRCFSCPE